MNKTELKEALMAMTIAATIPASANATSTTPLAPEKESSTVSQNNNLQRNINIKEVSSQGKTTTRHVYDWQEVVTKYYLDASEFSKDTKLSKEQELECAAVLRAITRYEAGNHNAIEDKYYHDVLLGKITDEQCQTQIEKATNNPRQKTFTQLIAEERELLQNNKSAKKEALADLEKFREQNDMNKGIILTDKVDAQIDLNNQNSKTLSATFFLQKLNERV